MGDVDERDAKFALQAFQFAAHADPQKRIEGRQRFVQQQNLRFGDQGAGKGDTLLLAAGKLRRQTVGERNHMHQFKHFHRPALAGQAVNAPHAQAERHVVGNAQMRKQRIVLEHHRRSALCGRKRRDIASAQQDRSFGHRLVSGDHAKRRGLAASRRSQQAGIGSCVEQMMDRVDGDRVTVALRQSDKFQVKFASHCAPMC